VPGDTAQTTPLGTRTDHCRRHQVSKATSEPNIVNHDAVNRTELVPQSGGLLQL